MSVSPAVMPQTQKPLWPIAKPGEPVRIAPAACQSGVRTCSKYHGGGAEGARCGSLARSGLPDMRAAAGNDPVIRAAAAGKVCLERGEIGGKLIENACGVEAGMRRWVLNAVDQPGTRKLTTGRVEREERFGAIRDQDAEAGHLDVPVRGEQERLEFQQRKNVGHVPGRWFAPHEGELVRLLGEAGRCARGDPGREGGHLCVDPLAEGRDLPLGRAAKADPTAHPVRADAGGADPLCEPPTTDAPEELKLSRAVLALAEADGEEGVVIILGLDVRHAVLVAADGDGRVGPARRAVRHW